MGPLADTVLKLNKKPTLPPLPVPDADVAPLEEHVGTRPAPLRNPNRRWYLEEAAARNYIVVATLVERLKTIPSTKNRKSLYENAVSVGRPRTRKTISEEELRQYELAYPLDAEQIPGRVQGDFFTFTDVGAAFNMSYKVACELAGEFPDVEIQKEEKGVYCLSRQNLCEFIVALNKDDSPLQSYPNPNAHYVTKNRELLRRIYGEVQLVVSNARIIAFGTDEAALLEEVDTMQLNSVASLFSLGVNTLTTR